MAARSRSFMTAKHFACTVPTTEEGKTEFLDLLDKADSPQAKEKTIVKGLVVGIEKDIVVIDVGLKAEGRVPINEFKVLPGAELPQVGDFVDVYVVKIEGKNGWVVVSRGEAIRAELWQVLLQSFAKNELVEGTIFTKVKGGFAVDVSGVVAFLPASQLDIRPIKDPAPLMNVPCKLRILKIDPHNIVVSRRAVLEESRAEAKADTIAKITEGMVLKGVVKNITEYGAFVDLGYLDALLHITDISYKRISHPSEVLKLGQEIEVMVIKVDKENQRLHVGLKQLEASPWQDIDQLFKVGQLITGKIIALSDHNIFVELDEKEGIEGVVPYTEISWGKLENSPRKLFSVDQEINCIITSIDKIKGKISLSIKKCSANPWQKFAQEHAVGDVITKTIRNVTDFGIFVALDQFIDGMIHSTDLSWKGKGEELLKNYNKGEQITCKVLAIDLEKERISLGIKQLTEDPYESYYNQYSVGDIVECKVIGTGSNDVLRVVIDEEMPGIVKKSDLSPDKASQKPELYNKGDKLTAKITGIDRHQRLFTLSLRALESDTEEEIEE